MAKPKTIKAEITPHKVTLSGNTYPIRKDIMAHGYRYEGASEVWIAANTPDAVTYAKSVAFDIVETGPTTPSQSYPHAPDPSHMLALNAMRATGQLQADDVDPVQDLPRRRIKRTEDLPAPTQLTQQTDIAAALAAFVATVQQAQPAQTPSVDLSQVAAMIDAALAPIREALANRPTQHITVTQGDTTRSVNGLSHKSLPDLIKCLAAGLHVWLAGPSGSGKTHGAEQAAEALGLTFRLQGAMTMAHELTGFVDAGGKYHETPFVTTFRNGGVILLDELDAGSNEALLALNAALANGVMCLPSGEIIRAHANFKCVGAANTFGQGATADYVGRTRIDAAFLQRFGARITWAYDEALETTMAGMPDWSERVQRARQRAQANGLKVLITPRASIAGAKLIRAGYTPDEAANLTYLADLSPAQRSQVG